MPVSFYAQISIIGLSLLITVLPFLGLPQSWNRALTAIIGFLILGVATTALYRGYVKVMRREERREQARIVQQRSTEVAQEDPISEVVEENSRERVLHREASQDSDGFGRHDYSVLQIIRD